MFSKTGGWISRRSIWIKSRTLKELCEKRDRERQVERGRRKEDRPKAAVQHNTAQYSTVQHSNQSPNQRHKHASTHPPQTHALTVDQVDTAHARQLAGLGLELLRGQVLDVAHLCDLDQHGDHQSVPLGGGGENDDDGE